MSFSLNVKERSTCPAHDVDERTIQSGRNREQKPVGQPRQSGMRDSKLTDESCSRDTEADHDERGTLLNPVGPKCEDDGHDHCEDVYRYGKQLGIGR